MGGEICFYCLVLSWAVVGVFAFLSTYIVLCIYSCALFLPSRLQHWGWKGTYTINSGVGWCCMLVLYTYANEFLPVTKLGAAQKQGLLGY